VTFRVVKLGDDLALECLDASGLTSKLVYLTGSTDVSPGAGLIAAERRRQVDVEGYSAEYDLARHGMGQLATAAWCYLGDVLDDRPTPEAPPEWPWADSKWRPTPTDPVRQLVKAGALIAAEIDRLLAIRAES